MYIYYNWEIKRADVSIFKKWFMNFSDACRRYSKNHRHVPLVHAHVWRSDSIAVHTRMQRKERDNVRARQWSDVRSPVQRPGFTCARTKINCNQHRWINQIVRRVGSEWRIGTVGTGQSSAFPFGWFVDGTLYANRSTRETFSYPNVSLWRPMWQEKGERAVEKSFAISKFHVTYKGIISITDKTFIPIKDIFF